jgi:hypothetical protein
LNFTVAHIAALKKDGKIASGLTVALVRVGVIIIVLYYGGFFK